MDYSLAILRAKYCFHIEFHELFMRKKVREAVFPPEKEKAVYKIPKPSASILLKNCKGEN